MNIAEYYDIYYNTYIEHEAREISHLVVSICLSVYDHCTRSIIQGGGG